MGVSLREVFTPLFSYVLLFVRTPGQRLRSYVDLRQDIQRLLEEEQVLVKRHDIQAPDYDSARFAVAAWVDELVMRHTHDSNKAVSQLWKRSPLQVELYNTANAGEEFYERLARLNPAQTEIREIYHLCLCLGFRGRYYDESQEYKMVELRRAAAQHLPNPVRDLLEIEKSKERVTPQPYAVQAPAASRPRRSSATMWAALAAVLAAAAVAAVVFYWPREPAQRPHAEILADLKERLKGFSCCRLTVVDFEDTKGVVQLAGRVESDDQRQQIRQAVKGVPEVTGEVLDTFTVIPRPFCDVLEIVEPLHARAKQAGFDLSVQPQKGCEVVYRRGENLVVSVTAPKPLQNTYVDYFVADREAVAHLLPNPKQRDNLFKSSNALTLGESGSDTQWQVEPPFGMELITVISSPQPLFGQLRSAPEGVPAYLDELRKAVAGPGASTEMAAAYCFIRTEDR